MRSSLSHFSACLCGICVIGVLLVAPDASLCAPPPPAVGALSPLDGARRALDRAHGAQGFAELNGSLTNESAAVAGFSLLFMDSLTSGVSGALTPKAATRANASEKAFQAKVEALLKRYSLDSKALDALMGKAGTLPPSLVGHGHQLLADALALCDAYEKSHPSDNGEAPLSARLGKDLFPASAGCDFHVLSPTQVKIVPRRGPKRLVVARLEEGQWRLDVISGMQQSSTPKLKTITPQAAAFLKDIQDENLAAVGQKLKADPSLANSPPAFEHGDSGSVSDTPLLLTAFDNSPKIAALLIQSGANVNAVDEFGETSLDRAARFGSKAVAALLLAHSANISHKDVVGQTALHKAVESDDPATVALLLAHDAGINARDQDGKTPLALALASHGDHSASHAAIIKLLRQHGAK